MPPFQPPPAGSDPATDPASASIERLVELCLLGDEQAWRRLVDRYTPLVCAIARRQGLTSNGLDDAYQDVFTALVRQLPGLENRRGLTKWIMTTTERICRRQLRRAGREPAGGGLPLDALADPGDGGPIDRELLLAVSSALHELGGACEELLQALYRNRDRSYDEIAEQLGMARGSLGPRRARCLAKLLTMLEEKGWTLK